ncbi:vegetative cell wall protein gp1-like [Triticum dicoccoides]|uniref:vegetative cell wall protein gp1-like n=1 Tax=Triticum dicoccoides TaxID=85692 RepID=UPI00188FE157|nr:vegetative cell wall protein gp1-like [Triticum dicoccoides]
MKPLPASSSMGIHPDSLPTNHRRSSSDSQPRASPPTTTFRTPSMVVSSTCAPSPVRPRWIREAARTGPRQPPAPSPRPFLTSTTISSLTWFIPANPAASIERPQPREEPESLLLLDPAASLRASSSMDPVGAPQLAAMTTDGRCLPCLACVRIQTPSWPAPPRHAPRPPPKSLPLRRRWSGLTSAMLEQGGELLCLCSLGPPARLPCRLVKPPLGPDLPTGLGPM